MNNMHKFKNSILIVFLLTALLSKTKIYGNTNNCISKQACVVTDSVPFSCAKSKEIEKTINEAISLGVPIYNEGLHMACYRIYEWAAYKILYVYTKECSKVEAVLKEAVDTSHGDFSDTEKAWIMRQAFDKILGVPTETGPAKEGRERKSIKS